MGEVIKFPTKAANINREIEIILDKSKELQERSEALLRWAEQMLMETDENKN